MAVDRFRFLPAIVGPALTLLSACTGTIESAVPGGWDGTQSAVDPSSQFRSPNGTPQLPGSNPGAPGKPGSTANNPGGAPNAPGSTDPNAPGLDCTNPTVGQSPLRRLTHEEYDNSVRDLLGDATGPAKDFVTDTQVGLFDNTATTQTVPELLAEQYLDAAATLAEGITDVKAFAGCDPAVASTGANCVKTFVTKFGRRAYRRPLQSDEVANLMAVFNTAKSASDAQTGLRATVSAMLAAPSFLFKPEFGAGTAPTAAAAPGTKQASQYELAARLASFIWASVPDDMLLDAATANQLTTKQQVEAQARRMLADDRARPSVAEFYRQWFGLARIETMTKDTTTYPKFDDALRAAMSEESRMFIDDVIWNGDAKLATMLNANYSFLNKPLADLYGATGPKDATTFTKVDLNPDQRAGVMTQGAVLAAYARPDQSSPVKRGQWVRVRMLCQDLPDPPANVPQLPAPQDGVSNRERFAMHTNNPACSGCHNLIDGLGFGLEAYDGIGAFRTMDQGVPVDDSGEITATSDINGPYRGGTELAGLLAGSNQVRDCAPTQLLRYSMGRRDEPEDACSLSEVQQAFATSNGDLKELVIALTQTDAFWMYRKPE
jgi:Protein of unknown function (DUF1592)/Protein of unknown function (DUF1588)/Protein of unknown function (DUF1595)/Protein of unknown function (DUF1587)/Protein of unknown function (DUF1585)